MKTYIQQLHLSFDPFEPNTNSREFFEGGGRREVCAQIVERAMYGESLICVSGCLGSGKTSLAAAITRSFGDEAVVVNIVTTLFMNPDQFMDHLIVALQLGEFESIEEGMRAVAYLANQLQMDARSLLIQVDDAHELSGEVLKLLVALKQEAPEESIQFILFGESQLGNLLESTLQPDQLAILAEFELDGFGSEATIDYVRFKLAGAGYTKQLPLDGSILGAIHNASSGMPGAINALVRDELIQQFGEVIEMSGSELDALESQFSADVAAEESDLSVEEVEEFSASRDVEDGAVGEEESSNAGRYFIAAGILLVVLIAAAAVLGSGQESEPVVARISVPASTTNVQGGSVERVSLTTITERARSSADLNTDQPEPSLVLGSPQAADVSAEESAAALTPTSVADNAAIAAVLEPTLAPELGAVAPSEKVANEAVSAAPRAVVQAAEVANSGSDSSSASPSSDALTSASLGSSSGGSTLNSSILGSSPQIASESSAFEQNLLSSPASNFTVQVVGASSEANIQAFVEANELGAQAGYFETRLNGKPWYVVVVGSFTDRASAVGSVDGLPTAAKASGPWVRSLASIQADIRKLQSAN